MVSLEYCLVSGILRSRRDKAKTKKSKKKKDSELSIAKDEKVNALVVIIVSVKLNEIKYN